MTTLFSTPQFTLISGPDTRLVRYVRTSVPYVNMLEYELLHERVGEVLDQHGRQQRVLLVDVRDAVMNTEPAFEKVAVRVRQILARDFRRVAFLVKTAIGSLQVSRLIREDSLNASLFSDETAAISFLLGVSGFDTDLSPTSSVRGPRSIPRPGPSSKR